MTARRGQPGSVEQAGQGETGGETEGEDDPEGEPPTATVEIGADEPDADESQAAESHAAELDAAESDAELDAAESHAAELQAAESHAAELDAELDAAESDAAELTGAAAFRREAGVDADNPFGRLGRPMSRRSPVRMGFEGAIGVGLAYLLYRAAVNARTVIVLVVVAAFLAVGLNPLVSRLERLGLRRGFAVAAVFGAVALFFSVLGFFLVPPVVEQISHFVGALPGYVRSLEHNRTIADLDHRFGLVNKVQNVVTNDLGHRVVSIGSTIATTMFKGITILILTLYFLSSLTSITETAYRLAPRSRRPRVRLLGDELLARVGGYVTGAFVVSLIAGTTSLVFCSAAGVPFPLALALIVAVLDVIPLVGAAIGGVLVTVVAFFGSTPVGIATVIFYLAYQLVENYLIYPRVMKRSVDVNPAAAIVAALVGGRLLGVVGAVLAVPATAAIQLILREVIVPRQDSV